MKLAVFPAFSGSWCRETYHIFYDMKISEMLSKFNHVSASKTRLRRSFIASTSKCVSHRRSAAGSAGGAEIQSMISDVHQPTVRVSIIASDTSVQQRFAHLISQVPGFRLVSQHTSAGCALRRLPRKQVHVVLVGLNLPDHSGMDCVSRLKLRRPDTQFVMLTATEDADLIIEALSAGFSGYLLKDANVAEVLALVRNVYEGGSPISNHVARRIVSLFHRPLLQQGPLLSRRERQVLEMLARGYTYVEIAKALELSKCTVATYIRRTCQKLHVNSRAKAVAFYTNLSAEHQPNSPPLVR